MDLFEYNKQILMTHVYKGNFYLRQCWYCSSTYVANVYVIHGMTRN